MPRTSRSSFSYRRTNRRIALLGNSTYVTELQIQRAEMISMTAQGMSAPAQMCLWIDCYAGRSSLSQLHLGLLNVGFDALTIRYAKDWFVSTALRANAIGAGDVVIQCADALLREAAVRPYWTKVH